jgi:hypothetical protein
MLFLPRGFRVRFLCFAGGLLATLFWQTPAFAQDRYFSLALGTSQTQRSNISLNGFPVGTSATFGGVTWRNEPLIFTPYYGIKLGTYFSTKSRWGAEFEFLHSKSIARTDQEVRVTGIWKGEPIDIVEPLRNKIESVRFTNGVNILSLMPVYRFAEARQRWQPYVGLGVSYYILWSRNTVDNQERYLRYRGIGWGWQAQAGLRYRLGNTGALYAEFKYTAGPGRARTAGEGELYTSLLTFHQTFGYTITW